MPVDPIRQQAEQLMIQLEQILRAGAFDGALIPIEDKIEAALLSVRQQERERCAVIARSFQEEHFMREGARGCGDYYHDACGCISKIAEAIESADAGTEE